MEYSAALIGRGSEVLGFDDEMSSDHHWGPRLQIFLNEVDYNKLHDKIIDFFSRNLPYTFLGYSTNWTKPDPNDSMNQFLELKENKPINHRIEIWTVQRFLKHFFKLDSVELTELDWFTVPEQRLLEFTSGKVFYDNSGELTYARKYLEYFPDSIWKIKIIAQWNRISQEMVFVGRTGERGDDLGSRIEASRLVKYIIEMAFFLEKKYIPYEKWFTIAFKQLEIAKSLEPILMNILKENKWKQREVLLCNAYLLLVKKLIELRLIPKHEIKPINFYNRPQLIIPVQRIIDELKKGIEFTFKDIIYQIGTINQFIDISDNLNPNLCKKVQYIYK
ncbi:MAG: DUF4037 domain-containing protein [Promethearchaeota archaeon]